MKQEIVSWRDKPKWIAENGAQKGWYDFKLYWTLT